MKISQPTASTKRLVPWGPHHAHLLAALLTICRKIERLQKNAESRRASRAVQNLLKKELQKIRDSAKGSRAQKSCRES